MAPTDCRHCGEGVPLLARECRYCGTPNPAWRNVVLVGGALGLLLLAAVAALLFALVPAGDSGRSSVEQRGSAAGDFAWLEKAMKQCDGEAAKEPKALYFFVTPRSDEPRDDAGWTRIAINNVGNAILINAEDTLAGLRRKALRISTEEYTFSGRNEATREVFAWKRSVGVRKFVNRDAGAVTSFRIQFQSQDAARAVNWGATFERQPGNCYWVNAILRH